MLLNILNITLLTKDILIEQNEIVSDEEIEEIEMIKHEDLFEGIDDLYHEHVEDATEEIQLLIKRGDLPSDFLNHHSFVID